MSCKFRQSATWPPGRARELDPNVCRPPLVTRRPSSPNHDGPSIADRWCVGKPLPVRPTRLAALRFDETEVLDVGDIGIDTVSALTATAPSPPRTAALTLLLIGPDELRLRQPACAPLSLVRAALWSAPRDRRGRCPGPVARRPRRPDRVPPLKSSRPGRQVVGVGGERPGLEPDASLSATARRCRLRPTSSPASSPRPSTPAAKACRRAEEDGPLPAGAPDHLRGRPWSSVASAAPPLPLQTAGGRCRSLVRRPV